MHSYKGLPGVLLRRRSSLLLKRGIERGIALSHCVLLPFPYEDENGGSFSLISFFHISMVQMKTRFECNVVVT